MNPWEEVKQRLPVQDIIAEYVPVKRAGSNYKCICPFHNEKTPSLVISPQKQIWHCFGCGAGGDIFGWVSDIEHITRGEALQKLAKKAGVALEPPKKLTPQEREQVQQQKTHIEKGFELLEWSAQLYHSILKKALRDASSPLTKYCSSRKLSQETINHFMIGYAPSAGMITALAQKHDLDVNLLKEVGLIKENGKDRFSDRFMIPIRNHQKQVVGFTGRVLPYDTFDRPKYLNSPQNAWFEKKNILFGLDHAQHTIRIEKYAILVEGNMDVVSMHSAGVNMVIASQGTAVTVDQLKLLKRYTQTLYLALDNDNAGRIAAKKTYFLALRQGFDVKVVSIPENFKDIDEWRLSGTLPNTLPVKDMLDDVRGRLKHSWPLLSKEQQRNALLEFIQLLKPRDTLTQDQYMRIISTDTGFSADAIKQQLESLPEEEKASVEEVTTETTQVLRQSPARPVLNAFHTLVAHKSASEIEDTYKEKLFILLQPLFPEFLKDGFAQWLDIHADELGMIRENSHYSSTAVQQIDTFIDKNFSRYQLDQQLMEHYLDWKKYYQTVS